jgi:2,3-diketo-5-methylthio-1-phosphopentane phosphatase
MSSRVYLLDIEGTTTSISFVYDVLFPWVRARLEAYLTAHWDAPGTRDLVDLLRAQADRDLADGLDVPAITGTDPETERAAVVQNVLAQMDADRKTTALKALQGVMWRDGYAGGELVGHLFEDVPSAIDAWRRAGARVAIYSSGSVAAQRLLFGHSVAGDLIPQLDGFFDTTTGPKKEAASYLAIAAALDVRPTDITFVSDNLDELRAASEAGCRCVLSVRPGNPPVPDGHGFAVSTDFRTIA